MGDHHFSLTKGYKTKCKNFHFCKNYSINRMHCKECTEWLKKRREKNGTHKKDSKKSSKNDSQIKTNMS